VIQYNKIFPFGQVHKDHWRRTEAETILGDVTESPMEHPKNNESPAVAATRNDRQKGVIWREWLAGILHQKNI